MSARDEMVAVIQDIHDRQDLCLFSGDAETIADELIAAGYSKESK